MGVDLLHILNLGVLRDLCGSALKLLSAKRGYFPGRNVGKRLHALTIELKAYVRAERLQLHLRRIKNLLWFCALINVPSSAARQQTLQQVPGLENATEGAPSLQRDDCMLVVNPHMRGGFLEWCNVSH